MILDRNHLRNYFLLGCIILVMLTAACMQPAPGRTSPVTGITTWIDAVNARDYHRVYTLAPDTIREETDESNFTQAQAGNPLLATGNRITGYQVLNQTIVGNNAMITAQLILDTPGEMNSSPATKIPLYLKFIETFEHGEWKVWTMAPS